MSSADKIAVTCSGCGQEYHVPPPQQDQRAKCRQCGQEFVIAAKVVGKPVPRRDTPRRGGNDRDASANMAWKSAAFHRAVEHPASSKRKWLDGKRLMLVVGLLLVAVCVAIIMSMKQESESIEPPPQFLERGRIAKLAPPRSNYEFRTLADLVEAVEPAVVQVNTDRGLGSGFVLDSSGLIVTCHHCIRHARTATVLFADGTELEVIGTRCVAPACDLAFLQVEPTGPLPSLPLAGQRPKKADPVVAFGSPQGLSFTVADGSISALRTVKEVVEVADRLRGDRPMKLSLDTEVVQFTASTMPGNSGGPVVDYRGNVIGVAAFVLPYRGQSFEFAISYEQIAFLARNLDPELTTLEELDQWERAKLPSP